MAFDVGVRDYLQGKGVSSGDIGYDQNSGNVTVKGQNFYRPELNMAGTTYSNQQNLDNAYGNYAKQQNPQNTGMMNASGSVAGVTAGSSAGTTGTGQGGTGGNTGKTTAPYTNPYTQMIGDLIKHLSDSSNSPQPDIYNSPQYAAAKANQERQSADAVRHANESAAGAGLGHSTIMTDRSQRIQDDSNNYLQTQLVPQIMSQLQAQKQQELANQQNQLHDYMQLGQQADSQHNADRTYDAGRQDAATNATGYYNPSGLTADQINQEIAKNSADYANSTPEQQIALHNRNIELNGLLGKTDSTGSGDYVGGNPNGNVGYHTVAGKAADAQSKIIQQQLTSGQITNETAQFKLDQLKDPNSPVNQAAQIDLQLKQIDLANAPMEQKLKIQEMQKRIAQIGAAPYRSPEAKQKDQLEVEKLKAEIGKITATTKPPGTVVDPKVSTDNHATITKDLAGAKDAAEANALIEANRDHLTDADYKDLKKKVIDQF